MDIKNLTGYLARKGVPVSMIRKIRESMAADAVTEAENVHWDRIFSCFAYAVYDVTGMDTDRLMQILKEVNDTLMDIEDGEMEWPDLMQDLKDKTGLVVRTGGEDRLIIEVSSEEE